MKPFHSTKSKIRQKNLNLNLSTSSFEINQATLKKMFPDCCSQEKIYQIIIDFGKKLPPFESEWKTENNRVQGCQSLMYLKSDFDKGKMIFAAASDALISAGLAALLLTLYNKEAPEIVIKNAPTFLQECGIAEGLTPGRANGLASLYLRMKQEALKCLVN